MNNMKKYILFGICVTSLILLVAPTIPAQQYNVANDAIDLKINEQIDIIINNLQKIGINENEINYYESNTKNALNSIIEYIDSNEYDSNTIFLGFILSTIISLIFSLIGTIFGIIFGPVLTALIQILTAPAIILAKLIALILG